MNSPNGVVGMRRVALASCVGTTIEFYDFFIYGTAAALVFPKVFFPALGAAAGTVASFATIAVAFVARPIGAMIFGHYGDRYGRKQTLIATLLLMGTATVLIGLLPGAATIGVAAPVLLVVCGPGRGLRSAGNGPVRRCSPRSTRRQGGEAGTRCFHSSEHRSRWRCPALLSW
jgi:MFS family permease